MPTSLAVLIVVALVGAVVRRLGNGGALGGGLALAAVGLVIVVAAQSHGRIVVICIYFKKALQSRAFL